MKPYCLEVCADSVESALEAQKGGADRIELCGNLVIGGVSPGRALFRLVKKYTDLEVRVLLRPRYGDYCYNDYEFEQLKEEVELYKELGADGVVIGMLRPDGALDVERMRELVSLAGHMDVALHRAFDICKDPFEALEEAVSLGMKTILTGGQEVMAWEGRETLAKLQKKSAGRIQILAGGGIGKDVIRKLLPVTEITSYHMSGKRRVDSAMKYRRDGASMGQPGQDEFALWRTDGEKVAAAVDVLKELTQH